MSKISEAGNLRDALTQYRIHASSATFKSATRVIITLTLLKAALVDPDRDLEDFPLIKEALPRLAITREKLKRRVWAYQIESWARKRLACGPYSLRRAYYSLGLRPKWPNLTAIRWF